nr:MAG TPA: hypothetical protein [Caudoviricetes sp.]
MGLLPLLVLVVFLRLNLVFIYKSTSTILGLSLSILHD